MPGTPRRAEYAATRCLSTTLLPASVVSYNARVYLATRREFVTCFWLSPNLQSVLASVSFTSALLKLSPSSSQARGRTGVEGSRLAHADG